MIIKSSSGVVVRHVVKLLFCFSLLAASSIPAFASQTEQPESETTRELLLFYEVDELFSVSFFPTTTQKAPGNSYVITDEQIELSPARSLRDVIETRVPGMTTGGHERHGPLIGTRGIFVDNNAKTLVMLDEQHINQRSHFGYTTGLLSPLLGDIKKVEVTLGPGAILHGSGALNGFINLIPKNGRDDPGLFINSEYGFAEELWKVETGYGASYGEGKNFYIYGGAYGATGYEPDELYGYTKTFDIKSNGFEGGNYRFSLYWNHENFNLNSFYYENNPYKNSSAEIGHFHQAALGFRPKYLYKINSTDSWEVSGSLLWFDHRSPGGPIPVSGEIADRGGAETHWELRNVYRTVRWDRHSLAAGFSYGEKRFYQDRQFFSEDAETWLGTIDTKWEELSVFSEDVIALNDAWTASFGLRYDKIYLNDMSASIWASGEKSPDEIRGHYSPRIATAYQLDSDTTVKASYQHGFRTPDVFYYLFFMDIRDAAESIGIDFPSLEIETMDSYELGLSRNLAEYGLKIDFNLFYNIFKDQLSFQFYDDINFLTPEQRAAIKNVLGAPQTNRLGSFLNAEEEIRAHGGEMNATFQPLANTEIKLSYGYVNLTNESLMRYPEHQFKMNTMSYFLDYKLSFGLNFLYNSSYSASDLPTAHEIYRDDRYVVDMSLNYNLSPTTVVSLIANNLFENDVPPMVFEPNRLDKGGLGYDSRRVYLSLRLKF